ncbi:MAG: hypothetical protein EA402_08375 [Planctomycetota bacterium]|nr:MAG: hypothetical protein EA402_08375 [Planctomycetota bacterium]
MALPLQPNLRPAPPWLLRILMILGLAALVLGLGWIQEAYRSPPRLLETHGREDGFVATTERHIDRAQNRVWVMLFVLRRENDGIGPVTTLVEALARAAARGVDVRVVLDQSLRWGSDEVETKHIEAAQWLESLGVPVLIDSLEQRTHAKTLLIDDRWTIIGSHNWTFSALARNVELSLLVEDRRIAKEVAAVFRRTPGWEELR